ncbi:MAG: hypothetical protein JJT82_03535 [Legionellaceae bacterium]|nr:hypothetical protein [Legionellaceae bacterium]
MMMPPERTPISLVLLGGIILLNSTQFKGKDWFSPVKAYWFYLEWRQANSCGVLSSTMLFEVRC